VPWAHGETIPEIEMRPGIVLVPVRTPTLPPATHTNCYVIGGDEVVVIDPASPYEEEQAVLDRVLEKREIREIWLTHLHRDHVSGANHLKEKRGVKIAAHPITARDLAGFVDVDRTFEEEERLHLAGKPGWNLRVMHTPGHARGHVCIFEEKNGSLFTGDLMAGFGTIVIDPPEGHMATYFDSLRRMQALPVTALFPAHGPVMANAKAKIQEYLDHRMDRERKILAAWDKGHREPAAIVRHVYTDVAPAMHALVPLRDEIVKRPCVATLEKLAGPVRAAGRTHLLVGYVHRGYERLLGLLARDAGYASAVIVRGVEGGVVPSVQAPADYTVARRGVDDETRHTDPAALGIASAARAAPAPAHGDLAGVAAAAGRAALEGAPGPTRDGLVLAGALVLHAVGRATSLPTAADAVRRALDSGAARVRFLSREVP